MKKNTLLLLILMSCCQLQAQSRISAADFSILNNTSWQGTLTYIDGQTGNPTDIATTMQIKTDKNIIIQDIQYVWEPDKNVHASTRIRKGGDFSGNKRLSLLITRMEIPLKLLLLHLAKSMAPKQSFNIPITLGLTTTW